MSPTQKILSHLQKKKKKNLSINLVEALGPSSALPYTNPDLCFISDPVYKLKKKKKKKEREKKKETMDIDDFRTVLESSGVDVWTFIETAISVASMDYGSELKRRRDGIVERLYAATASFQSRCQNCDEDDGDNGNAVNLNRRQQNSNSIGNEAKTTTAVATTAAAAVTDDDGSEDLDPYCGLFEDQQKRILEIKEHLEYPQQFWFFFFFFFI